MRISQKKQRIYKIIEYVGFGLIIIAGLVSSLLFNNSEEAGSFKVLIFMLGGMMVVLVIFLLAVIYPMNAKLSKQIIIDSLEGLVTNVTFNKKKGYTKETFESFCVTEDLAAEYQCQDYFTFDYKGQKIESASINYFTMVKVKDSKTNKNVKKDLKQYFGRVYLIPFKNTFEKEIRILGKETEHSSKKNRLNFNYLPLTIKKYKDNFEVFYDGNEKPRDLQKILEILLNLKHQLKGNISMIMHRKSILLFVDNNVVIDEIDIKNKINEEVYKKYRKNIAGVLSVIDQLEGEF